MLLLLIAVLALGAVACETDNPPQPLVEGPSLDGDRGRTDVTVRPPVSVTPREVTPTNLAPAPARPRAPRPPVVASAPAPRPPALAPPPAVSPTAPTPQHAPVGHRERAGGNGLGGVVNRVASPLP